ncbi:unnamed protein product [Timema podura]|uniref:Uncharacterized protein n=1 Tax=Timema podura TaxID=61482 RepID=A0ABN7NVL3_TIMPD|nr:unnamed protein product [Timema podura]
MKSSVGTAVSATLHPRIVSCSVCSMEDGEERWIVEAEGVVRDVKDHVQEIHIANIKSCNRFEVQLRTDNKATPGFHPFMKELEFSRKIAQLRFWRTNSIAPDLTMSGTKGRCANS